MIYLKGVIGCYMHFYKLFELNVCWQCVLNHPTMIKSTQCLFFNLVKLFPLAQIKPISDTCLCDVTQTQALPRLFD